MRHTSTVCHNLDIRESGLVCWLYLDYIQATAIHVYVHHCHVILYSYNMSYMIIKQQDSLLNVISQWNHLIISIIQVYIMPMLTSPRWAVNNILQTSYHVAACVIYIYRGYYARTIQIHDYHVWLERISHCFSLTSCQ